MAEEHLYIQGDVHRTVTFLNKNLKLRGLIFGLSAAKDNGYILTIYDEPSIDYMCLASR
ncbi:MAG: DUF4264 family protein [bacterium]